MPESRALHRYAVGAVGFVLASAVVMALLLFSGSASSRPAGAAVSPGAFCSLNTTGSVFASQAGMPVSVTSVRSGRWSDGATWSGGRVPSSGDTVGVGGSHEVVFDADARVAGLHVAGTLRYDPSRTATLRSSENVVVTGELRMVPANGSIRHTLQFVEVELDDYVGGGLDVLASDVGLWVMENGQLVTQGEPKRAWTNAVGSIPAGASALRLDDASGWKVGDSIAISPTRAPDSDEDELIHGYAGFHEARITAVSGNDIAIDRPTTTAHPEVNGTWTAEVMNLTRNVVIAGEPEEGRAHIFIRANRPQFIRHTELVDLGPGVSYDEGYAVRGQVLGRYGLHFHHSFDGTQGSLVEGTSMHRIGHKGYVPHHSNGITFRDTVAYDGADDAYWWDLGDTAHDILWDRTIAAKLAGGGGGYLLGAGQNVEVRDSVSVGSILFINGGYAWENTGDGSWEFNGNISHNHTGKGIRVWQNSNNNHVLRDFAVYHTTGPGIFLGAYTNNYHFKDFSIYGTEGPAVDLLATSSVYFRPEAIPASVIFEAGVLDGGDFSESALLAIRNSAIPGEDPILIRDVEFRGRAAQQDAAIALFDDGNDKKVDLVDVTIRPGPTPAYRLADQGAGGGDGQSWFRVQNGTDAQRLRPGNQNLDPGATFVPEYNAWQADIAPPYPGHWGTGAGLYGEYFDDFSLNTVVHTAIDPYIEFEEELVPVYHQLDDTNSAARWSGRVLAQYTGSHEFRFPYYKTRFWVDGRLVVDSWNTDDPSRRTGRVDLVAGQFHDIVLEVGVTHGPDSFSTFSASLVWDPPGAVRPAFIPQSQLYPPAPLAVPYTGNDPAITVPAGLPSVLPQPTPNPPGDPLPVPPGTPGTPGGPGTGPAQSGYWLVEADGDVHAFGSADVVPGVRRDLGSGERVVDAAATPDGTGVWILTSRGQVISRGSAIGLGRVDLSRLDKPGEVVATISASPSGRGAWVFSDAGRVLALGDALPGEQMAGAATVLALDLDEPIVGSVATPSGRGAYLLAADGGVFALGDAAFAGSVRGALTAINGPPGLPDQPVVGIVADPDGRGYWIVAADGGVFAFEAPFVGSLPGILRFEDLVAPVNGMVAHGNGYLLIAGDGGVFNFSGQPFEGSAAGIADSAVVGVASVG